MIEYKNDPLTNKIIESIIQVHIILGPGFLEQIYKKALLIELRNHSINTITEKKVPIYYKNEFIGIHKLDILAENKIILELKTVDYISKAHYAQIKSYLKAAGLHTGILINFSKEKADFRRIEI